MLKNDPEQFRQQVDRSLRLHYALILRHSEKGTYFFDYGNASLKAVYDTGENSICKNGENDLDGFIFPSYVEDILGPQLFDYGYGPFRWCCLSGKGRPAENRPGRHGHHPTPTAAIRTRTTGSGCGTRTRTSW